MKQKQREQKANLTADFTSSLALNRLYEDNKKHQHFDMQPFFEWDLKVLPIAIEWLERARSIENVDEAGIDKQKLGAIYQVILAMPDVFEPAPAAGSKRKRTVVESVK